MAVYNSQGSEIDIVYKDDNFDETGWVHACYSGTPHEMRIYNVSELKADGGLAEIYEAIGRAFVCAECSAELRKWG